jgi:phospholipid-binding lipoprotein MlaA
MNEPDTQGTDMKQFMRSSLIIPMLASLLALGGCASGPEANPADPLEPFNRSMTNFNDGLDKAVLKPVATAYKEVLPSPIQTGVHNFFGNLQDMWSVVNNALQLKPQQTVEMCVRVGVNTTIGLAGLFDVASEMDIPRSTEDFGQTLGYWGVGSGPYVVLPVFGPSTLRDGVSFFSADHWGDVVSRVNHIPTRNSAYALRAVDTRMQLFKAEQLLDEAALDKYSFTRDSYLQMRKNQIHDGNPPPEKE